MESVQIRTFKQSDIPGLVEILNQHSGIGSALVDAVSRELHYRGAPTVSVTVTKKRWLLGEKGICAIASLYHAERVVLAERRRAVGGVAFSALPLYSQQRVSAETRKIESPGTEFLT